VLLRIQEIYTRITHQKGKNPKEKKNKNKNKKPDKHTNSKPTKTKSPQTQLPCEALKLSRLERVIKESNIIKAALQLERENFHDCIHVRINTILHQARTDTNQKPLSKKSKLS
jgi:hypothetical protein